MRTLARSVGFLLRLSWRIDRRRLLVAGALMLLGAAASPLLAVCLRGLTDSALAGNGGPATAFALAAGALMTAELMLAHFAHLYYFELAEMETEAVDAELIALTNGTAGMEHLDDPRFADTVALAREDSAQIQPSLEAVLQLAAALLQVAATTCLLVMFAPWLALLPAFALVPVVAGRRAQEYVTRARERTADRLRVNRHLLAVATSPAHVHEIRLSRMGPWLVERHGAGWSAVTRALWRGHLASALLRAAAQVLFALAFGAALGLVGWQASRGRASAGDVVLVLVLALMIGTQLANALNLMARVHATGELVDRLATLRRLAGGTTPDQAPAGHFPPNRLRDGIRLEGVGFAYPETTTPVLRDVTLHLRAGSTVALVGENGAGKSTLAKLLCGLYPATAGRISVDGNPLTGGRARDWRQRVAALFQDSARFQLVLRESIGSGDTARLDDDGALIEAAGRAQATPVVDAVPGGLDGIVGVEYADGAELSGGQWQRLALARTFLRRRPLLVVLDEPAAALDAAAEHDLFERFTRLSEDSRRDRGAVSVFISHRFSSARLADLIVVLHEGRTVESGSHRELMAAGGTYAELFTMQAEAYR